MYAVDQDSFATRSIAHEILSRGRLSDMFLCSQALGEFMAVIRRKQPQSTDLAIRLVERWSLLFPVHWTGPVHVLEGARTAERFKLQYWDSLIIAVAAEHGAEVLLSEDMQDGCVIEGITIVNPFKPENRDRLTTLLAD